MMTLHCGDNTVCVNNVASALYYSVSVLPMCMSSLKSTFIQGCFEILEDVFEAYSIVLGVLGLFFAILEVHT